MKIRQTTLKHVAELIGGTYELGDMFGRVKA